MIQSRVTRLGLVCTAISLLVLVPLNAQESSAVPDIVRELNEAFVQVAEKVSSAVVVIHVAHSPQFVADQAHPFWEMLPKEFRDQLEEEQKRRKENSSPEREPLFDGRGSGVVIRKDGYILTNRHVVEGAEKIRIRFADGRDYEATVRGVDAQSDIAVLKIDPKEELMVARLGDSSKTRVGEFAIAIGAPFDLDYSVTFGHISAKGRSRIIQDPTLDQDFLQTDANINPGNSGGPLVNIYGEVIGINTLIRGLRSGIGFAIPINLAREVADQLIENGKFVRAYLGIGIRSLRDDPELRNVLEKVSDGVVITQIRSDGPASASGLRASDVITAVDGRPVASAQQLKNELRSKKVGEEILLDVFRNNKSIQVAVKPQPWPEEAPIVASRPTPPKEETTPTLGMIVKPLTPELAEQYELTEEGVLITEVEVDSAAARKGLRAGDLITEVNQEKVTTPREFRAAIKRGDIKKGIILNFTSRGTSKFEILKDSGD